MINKTYETEIVIEGEYYFCSGVLELDVIDDGIGSYEYWGSKGIDHNWCYDIVNYKCDIIDVHGLKVTYLPTKVSVLIEYEKKAQAYIDTLDPKEGEEPIDDSDSY